MMTSTSLNDFPRELVYFTFQYLRQDHLVYSFYQLNQFFSSSVEFYVGEKFSLLHLDRPEVFQYCLRTFLPSIGSNLRSLIIGSPHRFSSYIETIKCHCPSLIDLQIFCATDDDDIRYCVRVCLHRDLKSMKFLLNGQSVGDSISHRLMEKSSLEEFQSWKCSINVTFHLNSSKDLFLLKRLSESDLIANGLYMFECPLTGEWLTNSEDDLCIRSKTYSGENLFFLRQIDVHQCSLEYEIVHVQTQRRLTVLIPDEDEERILSSSILSIHRKESFRSCSTFTFETFLNDQVFIRPFYSRAKRLEVCGKRIIISLKSNETTPSHSFKLHRRS